MNVQDFVGTINNPVRTKLVLEFSHGAKVPCLWESGGATTHHGDAILIANPLFKPKQALYVPRGGHLANGQHALIPVMPGDIVLRMSSDRGANWNITLYMIERLRDGFAEVIMLNHMKENSWQYLHPAWKQLVAASQPFLPDLLSVGMRKANEYHCRTAYFAIMPKPKILDGMAEVEG